MKSKKGLMLATLMLTGALVGSFSGCLGVEVENDGYDATKANLSVATYDGGVGRAWLDDAARRFEEKYANATHFQEGRVGVKISVDGDKIKYGGNNLAESGKLNKDIYFTEAVDYYKFVNSNMVMDITDVVQGSMADYGEDGTIEDKIDDSIKDFMTKKDGKYYMIPFYDGFYGFSYDIDLFEDKGFYLDDDGDFFGIKDCDSREEFEEMKANGPDGEDGTYDDGLPATYEEMILLCDQIAGKGCIPFCYSGNYPGYVNRSFFGYVADHEGYDGFMINNTFKGTATLIKSITDDGSLLGEIELEEVVITKDNGYEVQRQAGKYYAMKMQEALFGSPKYVGGAYNGLDYTVAQADFIKSKYAQKPYAMLAEGVWWENEAQATFVEIETLKGEKKSDRNFGFMPVPKASAEYAGPQTMFSVNNSFGFINKTVENEELAKEFMRFLHTDAEMSKFSAKTSIPRSLQYEVTPEDRETATPYGKSLIDMRSASTVVYPFSSVDFVINHAANFDNDPWFNTSTVGGKTLNNPFSAFKDGKATAKSYFEGLWTYQKSNWSGNTK